MDWGNVTVEDLVDALREVDWSSPPRPLSEFFSRFTVPKSFAKWDSRLKCNLYYYRTNYFIMIVFILGLGFRTRPLAILSALLTTLSVTFLNDSFAGSFSEKATRTVRRFSSQLTAKMRPPLTPVIRGRPSAKRAIHICGQPRWVFVLIFSLGRNSEQYGVTTVRSRVMQVANNVLLFNELGLYKAQVMLPFNAFGTIAMAREEFENDSGSSQVFWLLKVIELTSSNSNILDGRYAVFGYFTQNEDFLADLFVGDVIESIQVVSGLDNLVNPSYKIADSPTLLFPFCLFITLVIFFIFVRGIIKVYQYLID